MGVCSVKFLSAFVCLLSLMGVSSVKFVGLFVRVTVSDKCLQCEVCWAVYMCLLSLMGVCSVKFVGLFICVYCF